MTDGRYSVGDWVRCTHPDGLCVGRFVHVDGPHVAFDKPDGLRCWATAEFVEKWRPLPGETARVTKSDSFPRMVGSVVYVTRVDEFGFLVRAESGNLTGEDVALATDTEFEPVFEERETALPPASFNGIEFPTMGPLAEKPNEALVREAERQMKRDVDGWRERAASAELDALAASLHLPKRDDGEPDAAYRERLNAFVQAFNSMPQPGHSIRIKRPEWTQQERTHPARPSPSLRAKKRMADVRKVLDAKWDGRKER